jgi:hypothetical protein
VEDPGGPTSDGLLHANLSIRSGREHGSSPILFVPESDTGNAHYQYDFDRDGASEWALESPRLRLIVSPADGGRALALVDKVTGDDLITLGGALHDFVFPAGAALPEARAAGDFAFNRAYHGEWVAEKQDTSLRLTYREYQNSTAGIHVEKTLRLAAPETVETSYRVSDSSPASSAPPGSAAVRQSFVSMLSVPAPGLEEGNTHFCWDSSGPSPAPSAAIATTTSHDASGSNCEDFVPSGAPMSAPDGITRIKIVSAGRPTLAVEWTSGQMIVVPKSTAAELNLVVPFPTPTDASLEFTLRYTVQPGP